MLTGDEKVPIRKEGKRKNKTYIAQNPHNEIIYQYHPSIKHFYFHRRMYLNPLRFKKEHEERKYQFKVRLQRASIPLEAGLSECEDAFSFLVSIRIDKHDANKMNICQLNDIITDLAKDDFDQHLFLKICYDDFTVYLENHRYNILRMIDISHEGDVITASPFSEEFTSFPEVLDKHLEKIYEDKMFNRLTHENIIEQPLFEQLWGQYSSPQSESLGES